MPAFLLGGKHLKVAGVLGHVLLRSTVCSAEVWILILEVQRVFGYVC